MPLLFSSAIHNALPEVNTSSHFWTTSTCWRSLVVFVKSAICWTRGRLFTRAGRTWNRAGAPPPRMFSIKFWVHQWVKMSSFAWQLFLQCAGPKCHHHLLPPSQ